MLLADGRMVNLAGREPKGNSLEAMDLGFLLQVAVAGAGGEGGRRSSCPAAQPVPDDLEREIARRFVRAMGAHR